MRGYYGLVLLNGVFGVALLVTTLLIEFRTVADSGAGRPAVLRAQTAILATVVSLIGVLALTAAVAWQAFLTAR
jgi:hypothetical protein